jgi:hypothetical protein
MNVRSDLLNLAKYNFYTLVVRNCLPFMAFGHQTSFNFVWSITLKLGGQSHEPETISKGLLEYIKQSFI